MALRFRRGSESDRTNPSFVPEDGEPVWIVDTKRLYMGDGSTAGGILVTGSGGGSTPGINDLSSGVVLTITDLASTFDNDIEANADIVLGGGEINGTGNIDILGNITASSTITSNIANVNTLNVTAGINAGATVNAPYFVGDHLGSVFADDSTLIVDAISNSVTTNSGSFNEIIVNNDLLIFTPPDSSNVNTQSLKITSNDNGSVLRLARSASTDISADSLTYGGIYFARDDINGELTTGIINGGNNRVVISSDTNGIFPESLLITITEGKLGIGTLSPTETLDVRGNTIISGSLTAGAMLLSGSNIDTSDSSAITVTPAVTFNSDVIVENNLVVTNTLTVDTLEVTNFQTSGSGTPELASDTDILLTAGTRVDITQSPLKMASFTTTERNALTPQNGDVIYNTTDSKFQGYAGGTWVDLH